MASNFFFLFHGAVLPRKRRKTGNQAGEKSESKRGNWVFFFFIIFYLLASSILVQHRTFFSNCLFFFWREGRNMIREAIGGFALWQVISTIPKRHGSECFFLLFFPFLSNFVLVLFVSVCVSDKRDILSCMVVLVCIFGRIFQSSLLSPFRFSLLIAPILFSSPTCSRASLSFYFLDLLVSPSGIHLILNAWRSCGPRSAREKDQKDTLILLPRTE